MKNIKFEFLYDILDMLPNMVFVKNRQHQWVFVNKKTCEIAGVNKDELLGKSDFDFFPKEEAEIFWKIDDLVFETGLDNTNEEYITNATTGNTIVLRTKKTLYITESGDKYIIGIGDDITDKKAADEQLIQQKNELEKTVQERTQHLQKKNSQLEQSEEKYRSFIEQTDNGVILLDEDGKIVIWNNACEFITGINKKDAIQTFYWDIFIRLLPPEKRTKNKLNSIKKIIIQALSSGKPVFNKSGVVKSYRNDDTFVYIHQTTFSIKTENGYRLGSIIYDVTADKIQKKQIFEQEMYYQTVLQSIGDAVISTDVNTCITGMNPIAEYLTAWKSEDAIGKELKEVFQIFDGSTMAPAISPVEEVIEKGEVVHLSNNTLLLQKNGDYRQIADSAAPIRDHENNIIGIVLVFRDVTDEYAKKKLLIESERKFNNLVSKMTQALALHEIVCNAEGKPIDYIFKDVNESFEKLTGLLKKDIIGKKITAILPQTELYWIETYGKVAITGESVSFQNYSQELQKHFDVVAYQPAPNQFATIFTDITELKTNQIRIQENEYNLKRAQEVGQMGSWKYYFQTNELIWSENLYNLLGFEPFSVIPSNELFYSLVHQDDTKHIDIFLQKLLNTKESIHTEFRVITNDNRTVWFRVHIIPIIAHDSLVALEGANIDITDLKNSQLREQQLLYELDIIFQSTHDAVFFIEVEDYTSFRYIRTNQRHQQLTGFPSEVINGKSPSELLGAKLGNHISNNYIHCLETKISITYEEELELPAGKKSWETTLTPIEIDGKIKYIVGSSADITEKKLSQMKLVQSENSYRGLINNISESIFVQDENGCFIDINKAAELLYGYSRAEIIGKTPLFLSAPDKNDMNRVMQYIRNAYAGTPQFFEFWSITKYGKIFPKEVSLASSIYFDKQVVIAVARDISEKKQYELELLHAKEKAEASDKLKTAFLNNISHEIRTPLNGILGFSDIICKMKLTEEKKAIYLQSLHESSDRLINTITDYMDTSLLVSGNMNVRYSTIDIDEFLNILVPLYIKISSNKKLLFTFQTSNQSNKAIIHTDPELLKKVLHHLIDNAIKFTKEGTVDIGYTCNENTIIFFIKDSGVGISNEFIDSIFDRFTYEDTSNTREHEGSGLGLYICKMIVELLGGAIWVQSEKHKGSTFYFSLPYTPTEKPVLIQKKETPIIELSKNILLIAEDDLTSFLYYQAILQSLPIEIFHARDGKEAVEFCQANPSVSLILMDIKMPVMNGLEATRTIKAMHSQIPIIAITAHAMSGDEHIAKEAGCDGYLTKPVESNLLIETCKMYLRI